MMSQRKHTNIFTYLSHLYNIDCDTMDDQRDLSKLHLWIRGSLVGRGQMISEEVYSKWPHKGISHTDDSGKVTVIKAIGNQTKCE